LIVCGSYAIVFAQILVFAIVFLASSFYLLYIQQKN